MSRNPQGVIISVAGVEATATHPERIMRAVTALIREGQSTCSRQDVRDRIGLSQDEWMSGYTAVFQAMRADQPGGAPSISGRFKGVFRRVSRGQYELTDDGRNLVKQLTD